MKQHFRLPALLALLAIGLSGCIWVGPRHHDYYGGGYYRPAPPPPVYHPGY